MAKIPQSVLDLASGIGALQRTLDALVEEWKPEPPPINTSMSAIGRALIERANPSSEELSRVFGQVEAVLQDGTESEKDAVATGFLEAVLSEVDRTPERRWILDHAGPRARAYIEEWNRFCGITE